MRTKRKGAGSGGPSPYAEVEHDGAGTCAPQKAFYSLVNTEKWIINMVYGANMEFRSHGQMSLSLPNP